MVRFALRMAASIDGRSPPVLQRLDRLPAIVGGPSSTPIARKNCGDPIS